MARTPSWRERFAPRIQRILDHYTSQHDACARALRRYYPLTPPWRGGPAHPYRIWRDEIARQRGCKPRIAHARHNPRCVYTLDLFAPPGAVHLDPRPLRVTSYGTSPHVDHPCIQKTDHEHQPQGHHLLPHRQAHHNDT